MFQCALNSLSTTLAASAVGTIGTSYLSQFMNPVDPMIMPTPGDSYYCSVQSGDEGGGSNPAQRSSVASSLWLLRPRSEMTSLLRAMAAQHQVTFDVWLARILKAADGEEVCRLFDRIELRANASDWPEPVRTYDRQGRAADTIRAFKLAGGVPLLRDILADTSHPYRWQAIRAIISLQEAGLLTATQQHEFIRPLAAMLRSFLEDPRDSTDGHGLSFALRALGLLGAREAIPDLQALFDLLAGVDDHTNSLPALLLLALGTLRAASARPALLRLAGAAQSRLYREAIMGLAHFDDDEASSRLVGLLAHPNHDIRAHAAQALGRAGAREAILLLQTALHDRHDLVRLYAAQALVRLGVFDAAVAVLCHLATSESTYLQFRLDALDTLGASADPEIEETLQRAFLNPGEQLNARAQEYVRYHAACALLQHGIRAPLPYLLAFLRDPQLDSSAEVSWRFAGQTVRRRVPLLVSDGLRVTTIQHLSRAHVHAAVSSLRGFLNYRGRQIGQAWVGGLEVRAAAAAALDRLDPGWDKRMMREWRDFNGGVR